MLTMLIADHALREFERKTLIKNPNKPLKGIRLTKPDKDDDYLHIYQQDNEIICNNNNDTIKVHDDSVGLLVERIEEFLSVLEEWKDALEQMILDGCALKDLIDCSVPILGNPMLIIDDSNSVRVMSNHGKGEINSEWDYVIDNGCFPLEVMREVFTMPPYRRNLKVDHKTLFYSKPESGLCGALCLRIPSNDYSAFIGSLLIYEGLSKITPAMLQYVKILCNAVLVWFKMNGTRQPMYSAKEVLNTLLMTDEIGIAGETIIKNIIGQSSNQYIIIVVSAKSDANIEPYTLYLEEKMPNSIFCMCQEMIVALINAEERERLSQLITHYLKDEEPSVGISSPFTNLTDASSALEQAKIAKEYGYGAVSSLTADIMLSYIAQTAHQSNLKISVIHPAVKLLQDYDEKHGSDYYRTLYVYLVKDRSVTASLPILNIHRSTMAFRLERLTQLLRADLDDAAVRLWLLLSYRLCGLPIINDQKSTVLSDTSNSACNSH